MTNEEKFNEFINEKEENKDPGQESQSEVTDHADGKKEKPGKSKHKKEDKAERLEEELALVNDKYLRLYSEFDNYRKRTLKEKIELGKTASEEVILNILPVLDDFERALKAFEISSESTDALKHGIILIFNKFMNILVQQGLQQMKTIGEDFSTDFHEAITNIPAGSPEQKGKVIDEIEKGYILNGKVIRYAKVVVGN